MSGIVRKLAALVLVSTFAAVLAVAQTGPAIASQIESKVSQQARDIFYRLGAPAGPSETRLGLRYQIQLHRGDDVSFVPDTFEFKSGDRFRLLFQANVDGYVYIFHQGSSGRGHVLFPDPRIYDGENRVPAYKDYMIPPGGWFAFDETAGREQLFVFFSTKPVQELEQSAAARSIKKGIFDRTVAQVVARRTQGAAGGGVVDTHYVDAGQEPPPSGAPASGTETVAGAGATGPGDVSAETPAESPSPPPIGAATETPPAAGTDTTTDAATATPSGAPTGASPVAETGAAAGPDSGRPTEPQPQAQPSTQNEGPALPAGESLTETPTQATTEPQPGPSGPGTPQTPETAADPGTPTAESGTGSATAGPGAPGSTGTGTAQQTEAVAGPALAPAQPGAVVVMYAGCILDRPDGLLIHVISLTHR